MTPEQQEKYTEIAEQINAIITGKTKKAVEKDSLWDASRPSEEEVEAMVEAIDLVDYRDVDKMLNEWTYQAISSHYQTIDPKKMEDYANVSYRGPLGKQEIVFDTLKNYISDHVLNAEEIESSIGWDFKAGYNNSIQGLLNASDAITQANSEDLLDFFVEPGVGAYITKEQRQGKFFREYGKIVSPNDIHGPFITFANNPNARRNFEANWAAIDSQIRLREAGKQNPSISTGIGKLIVDIVEDNDDQGWIQTLFSDTPLTQSEWALNKDIAKDESALLANWAQDPKSIFSGESKFTPDTILKDRFGDYAVNAKKLYLDEFEQRVYQAQNEAREVNPNITTAELANITRTEAELAQQNWVTYLGQKQAEYQEELASENYEELIKDFADYKTATKSVDTWLGSTEISKAGKEQLYKFFEDLYPKNELGKFIQKEQFGEMGITDMRGLINATVEGLPEGVFSDWRDMGTLERIQGMEDLGEKLGEAETQEGRAARQRQGYAFSPMGDLKPFSAFRYDKETGQRIQEAGSELMKNLHMYPELVQRTILYGINRPQQDIVMGRGRETTLPQGLFEGLPAQTTTSITGKEIEIPYGTPPGEYGSFDTSFINMPDLSKPELESIMPSNFPPSQLPSAEEERKDSWVGVE